MKTLDQIGIEQQTDKASQFSRTYAKPHDYLRHFEKFFEPIRNEAIKFVEIGVGGGESVRTWLEFFPSALIIGIDIVHSTNEWNTPKTEVHGRYHFQPGDQSSSQFWSEFVSQYGSGIDVLIDDGSHMSKDVLSTHTEMWPHIASGGLYIMEDLACSYSQVFLTPGWPTPIDRLRGLIDAMNQNSGDVDSIYQAREIAIIRKK